jgi:uncharacterized protein (TIGR00725 family)
MKIAVCGSGMITDKQTAEKSFEIGKEIAKNNVLLLTGSGNGYPYEAVKGASSVNGKVIGISPAKDKKEHIEKYSFPTQGFAKIEYTGLGIPGRNYPLVKEADAIIIISGQAGSLNEFTIAFHYEKVIGILENSGGITSIIKEIARICDKRGESKNIVYSPEPKELVQLVINKLK